MSTVSTKNVGGGTFIPKTIQPGNHLCRITGVKLVEALGKVKGTYVELSLETEALPNFTGFLLDPANPSKGHHKGQVGRVTHSNWPAKDGVTTKGKKVSREKDLILFLGKLCAELGWKDWFEAQDAKYTVDGLYTAFEKEKPYANVYMTYCIAGRSYLNKKGYETYALFLPRETTVGKPFSKNAAAVQVFNRALHTTVAAKAVSSFGEEENTPTTQPEKSFTQSLNEDYNAQQGSIDAGKGTEIIAASDDDLPFDL